MRGYLQKRASDEPQAFALKACPRCLGDLVLQSDLHGTYYICLQCGLEVEPPLERKRSS